MEIKEIDKIADIIAKKDLNLKEMEAVQKRFLELIKGEKRIVYKMNIGGIGAISLLPRDYSFSVSSGDLLEIKSCCAIVIGITTNMPQGMFWIHCVGDIGAVCFSKERIDREGPFRLIKAAKDVK